MRDNPWFMRRLRIALFSLWAIMISLDAFPQDLPSFPETGQSSEKKDEKDLLFERSQRRSIREQYLEKLRQGKASALLTEQPLLASAIDPAVYRLGPGDLLQLTLWGELDFTYPLQVMPDGAVSIPTIGVLDVDDETLATAQDKLRLALEKKYRNIQFTLNLLQLRTFRVYVTGEVEQPATYFAQAQDRVSDIIELAGGPTKWADLGRINLRHSDGTIEISDLISFYRTGNLVRNPMLLGGDVIQVLTMNPDSSHVTVSSNKETLGLYPLRPNEHLLSFLQNHKILTRDVDLQKIEVHRDGNIIVQNYLHGQNGTSDIELKNGDHISISAVPDKIYVEGEVLRPGPHDFTPNFRSVDYAGMAGLTNLSGNVDKLKVVRASTGKVEKGRDIIVEQGDRVIVPRNRREDIIDYFQIIGTVASVVVSIAVVRNVTGN